MKKPLTILIALQSITLVLILSLFVQAGRYQSRTAEQIEGVSRTAGNAADSVGDMKSTLSDIESDVHNMNTEVENINLMLSN